MHWKRAASNSGVPRPEPKKEDEIKATMMMSMSVDGHKKTSAKVTMTAASKAKMTAAKQGQQ